MPRMAPPEKLAKSRRTPTSINEGQRYAIVMFGSLKAPGAPADQEVTLRPGATVDDLLAQLAIASHHRRFVQVVAGDNTLYCDDPLPTGQKIKLFLPVGGG